MGGFSILLLISLLYTLFFIFIAIFFIVAAYVSITYVFESIAVSSMLKNKQASYPYRGWIPFYNKYLLGKEGDSDLTNILGTISAIMQCVVIFLGIHIYIDGNMYPFLFFLFIIFSLMGFIFDTIIAHKIYKKKGIRYGDIFTVFSVLSFGFLRPIFLFIIRNKG